VSTFTGKFLFEQDGNFLCTGTIVHTFIYYALLHVYLQTVVSERYTYIHVCEASCTCGTYYICACGTGTHVHIHDIVLYVPVPVETLGLSMELNDDILVQTTSLQTIARIKRVKRFMLQKVA
jgi:hypothetical protein